MRDVLKIIFNDLENKRNYLKETKHFDDMEHFDFVLKYYLDNDFNKVVINGEKIE